MYQQVRAAAVDLGAENGRVVVGSFDGERLSLTEAHRFVNTPVQLPTGLHWNLPGLFQATLEGLRRAAQGTGGAVASVGVATWGVDFGLVDRTGALLGLPYHYRDLRTRGLVREAQKLLGAQEIYRRNGIQFMEFNTLYQLWAMARAGAPSLAAAHRLLLMPDLLHYWLTGVMANEWSQATTTQFLSHQTGGWDLELLERLAIPTHFLGDLSMPGTRLGPLTGAVAEETGCGSTQVVLPPTHDTASAISAVPGTGEGAAYISSGTWSLVGAAAPQPVLSEEALAANLTNEGVLEGTYSVHQNVMGLWLVQQIRATLARAGQEYSYPDLTRLAEAATAQPALFDPDDPAFFRPGDHPSLIREICRRTGQTFPETVGDLVRSTLVSLACKYRWVLDRLERILSRRLTVVHVVGGGSRNRLLCQLTADITGRPVLAGPPEATAVGSLLVQMRSLGYLGATADFTSVVRASFPLEQFDPRGGEGADETYQRWRSVQS